jgi:hypothetical protein
VPNLFVPDTKEIENVLDDAGGIDDRARRHRNVMLSIISACLVSLLWSVADFAYRGVCSPCLADLAHREHAAAYFAKEDGDAVHESTRPSARRPMKPGLWVRGLQSNDEFVEVQLLQDQASVSSLVVVGLTLQLIAGIAAIAWLALSPRSRVDVGPVRDTAERMTERLSSATREDLSEIGEQFAVLRARVRNLGMGNARVVVGYALAFVASSVALTPIVVNRLAELDLDAGEKAYLSLSFVAVAAIVASTLLLGRRTATQERFLDDVTLMLTLSERIELHSGDAESPAAQDVPSAWRPH